MKCRIIALLASIGMLTLGMYAHGETRKTALMPSDRIDWMENFIAAAYPDVLNGHLVATVSFRQDDFDGPIADGSLGLALHALCKSQTPQMIAGVPPHFCETDHPGEKPALNTGFHLRMLQGKVLLLDFRADGKLLDRSDVISKVNQQLNSLEDTAIKDEDERVAKVWAQLPRILKENGAMYGPLDRQSFIASSPWLKLEPFLGEIKINRVETSGVLGDQFWDIDVTATLPDHKPQRYNLRYDVYKGNLLRIASLDQRGRESFSW